MRKIGMFAVMLLFFVAVRGETAWSAINQIQQLYFGSWFFGDNNSQHTITVDTSGNVSTSSSSMIMFTSPQPGVYSVTGLPAFTTINTVTVTMTQPMESGSQEFTLDNFTTQIPDANGAGVTTLTIGGTAYTSGDGNAYTGGTFVGDIFIEIDY